MTLTYALAVTSTVLAVVNLAIIALVLRKSRRIDAHYQGLHLVIGEHPWIAKGLRDLPEPGDD